MKFRTQFDPKYKGTSYEPKGKSMTVPGQALTVREIIQRQASGLSFESAFRNGEYFEDMEVPHFDDITDYYAWKNEQEEYLKDLDARKKGLTGKIKELTDKEKQKQEELLYDKFKEKQKKSGATDDSP